MSEDERRARTRREYRELHHQARFVYVVKRGDHTEVEPESGHGRLILPWAAPSHAEGATEHPGLTLPSGDWTLVPYAPGAGLPDVTVDDPLPETPAAFKRIRDAITKMADRDGDAESETPQFLDPSTDGTGAGETGVGEWWDESATDAAHELTTAPATGPSAQTAPAEHAEKPTTRQVRAAKKAAAAERAAQAREEKARKAEAKRKYKLTTLSEEKRQALVAKEQNLLNKRRLQEAQDEQKIEGDEVKARVRRDRKAIGEWERKQKRREAIRRNGGKEGFWQGTNKPKPIEVANAIRSLAIILETSPAEVDAVKLMAEEFSGNRIGDAFDRIYDRLVKDNMTLVEAFEPEEVFPLVVHNMLRVGARTAKPGPALRTAVDLLDAGNDNSRALRNAVMEPLILAVLSLVLLFATAWGVMPVFVTMYDSMDLPIGIITQFVLVFAAVSMWVIGILAVLAAVATTWWFAFGRSSLRVRIAIDRWKLHAPLIGKGEQTGEAFQMFNILDSYLSVGSTEREALINTAAALQNRAVKRHLRATANGLTRGEKTFAQFLDDDMFPRMARSILGAGQRTGQTVQVVKVLRNIYENEARIEGEQSVQKVVALVSSISSLLFTVTAVIVTIPPLEIFGATLGFRG